MLRSGTVLFGLVLLLSLFFQAQSVLAKTAGEASLDAWVDGVAESLIPGYEDVLRSHVALVESGATQGEIKESRDAIVEDVMKTTFTYNTKLRILGRMMHENASALGPVASALCQRYSEEPWVFENNRKIRTAVKTVGKAAALGTVAMVICIGMFTPKVAFTSWKGITMAAGFSAFFGWSDVVRAGTGIAGPTTSADPALVFPGLGRAVAKVEKEVPDPPATPEYEEGCFLNGRRIHGIWQDARGGVHIEADQVWVDPEGAASYEEGCFLNGRRLNGIWEDARGGVHVEADQISFGGESGSSAGDDGIDPYGDVKFSPNANRE